MPSLATAVSLEITQGNSLDLFQMTALMFASPGNFVDRKTNLKAGLNT